MLLLTYVKKKEGNKMNYKRNNKSNPVITANNIMTTGNLQKQLILFALPILLGSLLQQLYNVIDAVVAGRLIDSNALSAIGAAIPVYLLLISVIMGIAMGVMILLSQLYGANQEEQIKRLFSTMMIFLLVLVVIIGTLGAIFARPMLKLIGAPGEILHQGTVYLQILFLGVPFTMLYNLAGAAMRSLGDSKEPLYALLISSMINLVLNLIFVSSGIKIAGIALATILAQAVSGMYLWRRMRKKFPILALGKQDYVFDWHLFTATLKICIPMVIQQAAIFLSLIMIQAVINQFGKEQIAGMTAAARIEAFILLPVQSIGNAITIFTGQNIGAGQMERLKKGLRFSLMISIGTITLLSVCMLLFGERIIALIIGSDTQAVASGNSYFTVCAWFYPLMAIMYCLAGVLQGAGDTVIAAVHSAASIVARLAATVILAPMIGFPAIAVSTSIGWGVATVIVCARYFRGAWKTKQLISTLENRELLSAGQD